MPQDSVAIVENFWREVWKQPQDPDAIDRLLHEDFVITSGGPKAAVFCKQQSRFEGGR